MRFHITPSAAVRWLLLASATAPALAAPPSNSPYMTDQQASHVQDATSESIGQVNMITCVVHSMSPDALVNQGPYVALIDQNKCDAAKQASTGNSGDGSGASQAPKYMTAVVNSTRASNADPMIVSAWISVDQDGVPVTVFAHLSATAAPTTTDPYGSFRLDYCGKPTAGGAACSMNGFMQAGNGSLTYYETDSGGGSQVTALTLSSVGTTTGSGSVSVTSSNNGHSSTSAFDFAYNSSYFLRSDGSTAMCFSRDASDPETGFSVWRYGLYDAATGERISRNSGFPIQYTNGGKTYQGYVGYYGLSTQAGAPAPADGSSIDKVDYQNGSATTASYTAVQKGGRLMRFTRQSTTLQRIDQVHFNAFMGDVASSGLPTANTQYEMYWNEATGQFIAVNQSQCGQNGCQMTPLSSPVVIDPSFWTNLHIGIQGWSQSLGGDLLIDLANPGTPVDTTVVAYHTQDLVYPDDTGLPATLHCVSNCPTAASLHAYLSQGSGASPFVSATFNAWQPTGTTVDYTLSGNVLIDSSTTPVTDTAQADYTNSSQYQNGVMSGRLVENLTDAQCGADTGNNPLYCDWKISAANVYYQWQTGPNSWDQFSAVQDGTGRFVHFDAPLNVSFKVPANTSGSSPYGSYANTNLILQYGGFGDLWGIPGSCVSGMSNQPIACDDPSGTARYVSAFEIPYDPAATPQQGVVAAGGQTYLVKWLDREIRFAQKQVSTCSASGLTTSPAALPSSNGLQDPSSPSSAAYNGPQPVPANTAPRVIQGQVMY